MTREEVIAYFNDMNECTYGDVEPIQMAIKALEQEPCEDAISRQAVIDAIKDYATMLLKMYHEPFNTRAIMDIVQDLPSVTPQPKTGHWIAEKKYPPLSDAQRTVYRCSCCDLHFDCVSNYCPTCGAKMEMRIRNEETNGGIR